MNYLDSDQVHQWVDYPGLIDSLEHAHRGPFPDCNAHVQNEPDHGVNKFVSLVGWQKDSLIAVKLVGVFPNNLQLNSPEPSVQGVVVTFDAGTGRPLMVADGAAMTFRKTAADSALGARMLAKRDAKTLLVVGAGGLAPHMVEAHRAATPSINKVIIWNRTHSRAVDLARKLRGQDVEVQASESLKDSVHEADVISCVTMSEEPLIKNDWLKPGSHVDLVGAYLPSMREADDKLMMAGRIFVDSRHGMEGAGDLCQPVDNGLLSWGDINADLFELAKEENQGRRSPDEVTVFKNVGGGHLDLFTAAYLQKQLAI